jgi:hypothetical protein
MRIDSIDRIPPDVYLVAALQDLVDQCDIMLVLIDAEWAIETETTLWRFENRDLFFFEICAGLSRGIPVVPILLDGAQLPDPARLPYDLRPLVRRTAEFIHHRTVDTDVDRLIGRLRLTDQPAQAAPSKPVVASPPVAPVEAEDRTKVDAKTVRGAELERWFRVWPRRMSGYTDEVHLGASTPPSVSLGETFVARFAAYTDTNRYMVKAVIEQEAPTSQLRLDLDRSRWRKGTKVSARLECGHATVANQVQTFSWDGSYKILRFDVTVADNVRGDTLILRFDVAVEGLPIISLRPEVQIRREQQYGIATPSASFVEVRAPRSAFASYAASDRREVLGRIRSLKISTRMRVFTDCMSIRPGEQWKPKLCYEIGSRDIFWLFWSRKAMKSKWVDWEWRTALAAKTIDGIQPHPLEPSDLAPAPKELSALQFGTMYEWYIHHLRQSGFRRVWRQVGLWFRKLLHRG